MQRILDRFQPSVVVLQCGADSLSGDRLGQYNLSMDGHADCVRFFRKTGLPLMLLGGGGYTIKNVARVWSYETACALNTDQELDRNLPYNQYFEWFGPEYRLLVPVANLEDANLGDGYLDHLKETVLSHAEEIPIAPSVPIQDVPRRGLAHELGLKKRPRKEGDQEKRDKDEDSEGEEIERVGANPTWDEFDHRIQGNASSAFLTLEDNSSKHPFDKQSSRGMSTRVNHPNRRRKMTNFARSIGTNTEALNATQGLTSHGVSSPFPHRVCSSAPRPNCSRRTGRSRSRPNESSSAPRYGFAVEEKSSWRSLMASGEACATLSDLRWSTLMRRMRTCLLLLLVLPTRGVKVR